MFILSIPLSSCQAKEISKADTSKSVKTNISVRFEHIAINVPDPEAMAKWYTNNLGMKIVRGGFAPNASAFIADSGMHMMLELLHNVGYPIFESRKFHHTSMHFAFITSNIAKTQEQLLGRGATISDSLRRTTSGDQVMTLRDPWGFAIQFVERVKPMLGFVGLYPEHFAMNVVDSRKEAKWYADNLGFVVVREGSAPAYGMFIADAGKNMMYELYQNKDIPILQFDSVGYQSLHVAFMVNDIKQVKETLIAAGAKVAEDAKQIPSGDAVMMLRDPWGLPIQLVKRVNPMLK
jgi:catechol 2,3-dioxygenase-like lactoylglutathione lyase family enzyme